MSCSERNGLRHKCIFDDGHKSKFVSSSQPRHPPPPPVPTVAFFLLTEDCANVFRGEVRSAGSVGAA